MGIVKKAFSYLNVFFLQPLIPALRISEFIFLKAVSWDRTETVPKKMGRILEDPTRLL